MIIKTLLSFIFIIFVVSCSQPENQIVNSENKIKDIIKYPTTLQIDNTNFKLNVLLWRDYMPIAPIDGREMTAIVHIQTTDSSQFPIYVDADKIWVIDSASIWETTLLYNFESDSSFQISKKASDGPKWETGIFVDAVVRIVVDDSTYYYLKSENIKIERIY